MLDEWDTFKTYITAPRTEEVAPSEMLLSRKKLHGNYDHIISESPAVRVPTETETPGDIPIDTNDTQPRSEDTDPFIDDPENVGLTDVSHTRKIVQTSSNPLFADGVPEHLQCPEELIGVYAKGLPREELLKIYNIQLEVMANYNPNRPLTEVWPQFIEAERGYHANADPMQMMPGTSAGRLDWSVQIILDFPEVLVIAEEDPERFSDMRGENIMDSTHTKGFRVLRGGSWSSPARSSLVFHRFNWAPSGAFSNYGFRCVKVVSP